MGKELLVCVESAVTFVTTGSILSAGIVVTGFVWV
jgi:hypothetical protein